MKAIKTLHTNASLFFDHNDRLWKVLVEKKAGHLNHLKISYAKEVFFYVAEIFEFVAFAAFLPVLKITLNKCQHYLIKDLSHLEHNFLNLTHIN